MVRVRVLGVALDEAGQHVILLKPVGEEGGAGTILPVWIGEQEATSILIAVQGAFAPRPLSHDLMVTMLASLAAVVRRIEVTRLDGGTFFAEIVLSSPAGESVIDARPSDAIALASRTEAEVWVDDDVLARAGIPDTVSEAGYEDAAASTPRDEEKLAEFRRFLDGVAPEDFEG